MCSDNGVTWNLQKFWSFLIQYLKKSDLSITLQLERTCFFYLIGAFLSKSFQEFQKFKMCFNCMLFKVAILKWCYTNLNQNWTFPPLTLTTAALPTIFWGWMIKLNLFNLLVFHLSVFHGRPDRGHKICVKKGWKSFNIKDSCMGANPF